MASQRQQLRRLAVGFAKETRLANRFQSYAARQDDLQRRVGLNVVHRQKGKSEQPVAAKTIQDIFENLDIAIRDLVKKRL